MKSSLFFFLLVLVIILTQGCAFTQSRNDPHSYRFNDPRPPLSAQHEVLLGMKMEEVAAAWGDPWKVQMAGERENGHQRWIYSTGPSYYGESGPTRVIYFENGRVAGWETRNARTY